MGDEPRMSCQVEKYKDVLDDHGKALLKRHHAEIALDQDYVAYDPDWARYERMDAAGMLCIITLRVKGMIQGYCVMHVMPELHYRTTVAATMDILWLAPEYRGQSLGGLKLMRRVEEELKRRGVRRVYMGSKVHKDISKLFTALGYAPIEVWFSKLLREA